MSNLSNAVKSKAIEQFVRRRKAAQEHGHIRNGDLKAGQPCLFYCAACGIFIEKLPEDFIFSPKQMCSQCVGLANHGWLDASKKEVTQMKIPKVKVK